MSVGAQQGAPAGEQGVALPSLLSAGTVGCRVLGVWEIINQFNFN